MAHARSRSRRRRRANPVRRAASGRFTSRGGSLVRHRSSARSHSRANPRKAGRSRRYRRWHRLDGRFAKRAGYRPAKRHGRHLVLHNPRSRRRRSHRRHSSYALMRRSYANPSKGRKRAKRGGKKRKRNSRGRFTKASSHRRGKRRASKRGKRRAKRTRKMSRREKMALMSRFGRHGRLSDHFAPGAD